MWEHKNKPHEGFAAKYNLDKLVWLETRQDAFASERRMKKWLRESKIKAIEEQNPDWLDLTNT